MYLYLGTTTTTTLPGACSKFNQSFVQFPSPLQSQPHTKRTQSPILAEWAASMCVFIVDAAARTRLNSLSVVCAVRNGVGACDCADKMQVFVFTIAMRDMHVCDCAWCARARRCQRVCVCERCPKTRRLQIC